MNNQKVNESCVPAKNQSWFADIYDNESKQLFGAVIVLVILVALWRWLGPAVSVTSAVVSAPVSVASSVTTAAGLSVEEIVKLL